MVWATDPVTVEVVGLALGLALGVALGLAVLPELPELVLPEPLPWPLDEPPFDEPLFDVPVVPPAMVAVVADREEPRCEASNPRSSTTAERVLSTQ
jgi:hypothetical protein